MGVKISGHSHGTGMVISHLDSGAVITTTPPKDNGGDGSAFSPTDLAAASVGACAATILVLEAERRGIAVEGVTFEVEKLMNARPRRLGRIVLALKVATACSDEELALLVEAAKKCPVRLSLSDSVEVVESYERAPLPAG